MFPTYRAGNGMVCAVDHLAAGAGVEMLRHGGSAADAAVATSAVLAVTTQHMCGMGGDLLAVVHPGPDDEPVALVASGRAGSGADPERLRDEGRTHMPFRWDIRAVPVPGCVDGWLALHGRFGRLPLDRVLGPAIGYARHGFPVSPTLAGAAAVVADVAGAGPYAARLRPGTRLERPGVADALEAVVAEGRDGFYAGAFGRGLIALGGGEFGAEDLAR
ncbi:MAG TPA: gamma-glutamyltransferase, partial [Acidimicrobiales bacterium]|nr:gamma-glutamyltransferase [Acidimicrobiales bacterium]